MSRHFPSRRYGLYWFLSCTAVLYFVLLASNLSTQEIPKPKQHLSQYIQLAAKELQSNTSEVKRPLNQTIQNARKEHEVEIKETLYNLTETGDCINYTSPVTNYTFPEAKQHIVFVKVHKAASTTVHNILMRYALANNLNVMSRFRSFHIDEYNSDIPVEDLVPSCAGFKYDILCQHLIFNKTKIDPFFPEDTVYIGIVREPFQQFLSAFIYYSAFKSKVWAQNVVKEYPQDPIEEFFRNSTRYMEHFLPNFTFWDNRMSVDFGFPLQNFHKLKDNSTFVQQFLDNLNSTFDLVMVAEYFDESLVMMRRLLGWNTKDIIYLSRNVFKPDPSMPAWKRKRVHPGYIMNRFKIHQNLDIALYNFFLNRFKEKVQSQPPDFHREVSEFKTLSEQISKLCMATVNTSYSGLPHLFPASEVLNEFTLTEEDCGDMNSPETDTFYKVAKRYNQQFGGLNSEFAARLKFLNRLNTNQTFDLVPGGRV